MKANRLIARITDMSMRKAARIVGIALLLMFPLAVFAEFFVLSNIIVPGDAVATANNVRADESRFGLGIASYVVVIVLDVVVALTLYVLLRPVNKGLSSLAAGLRLLYSVIMGISLFALALLFSIEFSYGQLFVYVFFIAHVFVLGYLVFKSGYIPRILGVLLMVASFCYVILLYGEYFLPMNLYEVLVMVAMLPATFAEISLGVWLLLRRGRLPEM